MRSRLFIASLALVVIAASGCKKEESADPMTPPDMSFKTSAGYTYTNDTVGMNDTLLIGLNCVKMEENDPLVRFITTRSYDGGASTTIVDESFNQSTYSRDIQVITRSVAGTETYSFTVSNRDGITSNRSLTITVQ